jgi:hypothetical protein
MSDEPILISKKRASNLLGICAGTFDMMRRRGLIEAVVIGKRKLFRLDDVRALALTPKQRRALSRDVVGSVN